MKEEERGQRKEEGRTKNKQMNKKKNAKMPESTSEDSNGLFSALI